MQLHSKALGLTVGIFAGGFWFLAMSLSLLTGMGARTVMTIGSFHPFFSYSWIGMLWMPAIHLVGGFLLGWLFAKLYNALAK